VLGEAIGLTKLVGELSFEEIRDRVGGAGERSDPILDQIWPDWSKLERERVQRTLKSAAASDNEGRATDEEINAFVRFLADEGLESFFWRLRSFEEHAFRGNEFALEGMKSDLQGMAIAVEHVAAALGGTETQLYEKFKQLWHDESVLNLLRTNRHLVVQERLAADWQGLKERIAALRNKSGGVVAADLVMAHRIRGGVHAALSEDDQFELEGQFVMLMRAALFTFVEVRRNANAGR
jgi:hypothetical protein